MSDILEELFETPQIKNQEPKKENEEIKTENTEQTSEKSEEEVKTDEQNSEVKEEKENKVIKSESEEIQSLKKALEDSKKWGHQKNAAYVNSKKKLTSFLNKLVEDQIIDEKELAEGLQAFNVSEEQENIEEKQSNPEKNLYQETTLKLEKEFELFKRYNKEEDADENYKAFFYFYPLLSKEEQENILTYINEEESNVALEKVMIVGKEFNDVLLSGAKKYDNNILKYVRSLQKENEKLRNDNSVLKKDIDTNYGKVHNRSIAARSSQEINNTYKSSGDIVADLFERK